MDEEPVELYDAVDLRYMESDFDYVSRSLFTGVGRAEMILELRKREFSRAGAERYVARIEGELKRVGGSEEEYTELQRGYTAWLYGGILGIVIGVWALFASLLDGRINLAVLPTLAGIAVVCHAARMKRRYARLRDLL